MDPHPWRAGNPQDPSLRYVFLRFLRHGLLAWGGPVAQLGMMHRELVQRDGWISEERFRKQLAVYQALPGPEAHEMAVYFGVLKRGRWGGFLAGLAFMLPGVVLVTALAALYVAYADAFGWADLALYGARPAVLALIALGFVRLSRASLKGADLLVIGVAAAAVGLAFPQVSFILVLLGGGLAAALARLARGRLMLALSWPLLIAVAALSAKVGLLTFGGAYTAIPFLHQDAVEVRGWVTEDEFLDALALSGIVPGPLIGVAVFVAYQAAGLAGALVATVLVFAPAFAFTLAGHGFFERMVEAPRLHDFLLGVTAAVVGLILVALLPLAQAAMFDAVTIALALAAAAALHWKTLPVPVVLLGAALVGAGARLAIPA